MAVHSFSPLKREPRLHTILAFDLEGVGGEDGFVCGAIVGVYTSEFYTDRWAMWESLKMHGAEGDWLFSHNLEYDLPIVAGPELFDGELLFKRQGILKATYTQRGRPVRFFDSLSLFPRHSIEDLGELVGREKLEEGADLVQRISHGARWRDLTDQEQRDLQRYCTRDAEIDHAAVSYLQEELVALGGELQATISGCAMDLFRRRFHKWPWRVLGPETNELARPAFYGGRTENFAIGQVEDVSLYDINSLYPHQQSIVRFPHPNHMELLTSPRISYALDRMQGVAQVEIDVPEAFYPPLPARVGGRLFFPTGTMTGSWTLSELRAAIERGASIKRLDWVLGSDQTFNPFERYVETLYNMRRAYLNQGSSRELIIKLLLNSLYGRFGLDPKGGLWQMTPLLPQEDMSEFHGWTTSEINNQVVAYGPLQGLNSPAYSNVLIAAEIAAGARLALLGALEEQEENAVYCDTDAIITRGQLPVGPEIGAWKVQMQNGSADLMGPKEYALHNLTLGDRYVAKGIPETLARAWIEEGMVRFRRAVRIREAIERHHKPSEWIEITRHAGTVIPKRMPSLAPWDQGADWLLTLPWPHQQLVEYSQMPTSHQSAEAAARRLQYYPEWVHSLAAQLRLDPELIAQAGYSDDLPSLAPHSEAIASFKSSSL